MLFKRINVIMYSDIEKNVRQYGNVVSQVLFVIFVIFIMFFIVFNAEWILGDDKQTMLFTGSGKPMPMLTELIGGGILAGRFCPTAHQEYNLLTLFPMGYTPLAHYIFNAILFLALSIFSVILLRNVLGFYFKKDSFVFPIFVYVFLFIGCSHIIAYLDVIFGVRTISICYVLIFHLLFLYANKKKVKYLLYSTPLVLWVIYSGETAFSSFFVIGTSLLLFGYRSNPKALNRYAIFLVGASIVYLLMYAIIVYPNIKTSYTSIPNNSFWIDFLLWTPHAVIILIMSAIRLYYILVKKDISRIYLDSILFGGAVMVLANIVLRLSSTYYYVGIMVFLMPSILYWGYYYHRKRKVFYTLILLMLFLFIRPLHLFPYLIINNQHRRTTEMNYIRKITPFVTKGNYKLYFLTGTIPEQSFDKNKSFFVKRVLEETFEFETRKDIQVVNLKDITVDSPLYLFQTKEESLYSGEDQKAYLIQHYDSILTLGDLNCVFYKLKK